MRKTPNKEILKFIKHYGELQPDSKFDYVTIHKLEQDAPTTSALAKVTNHKESVCDLYWVVGDAGLFVSMFSSPDERCFVSYRPERKKIIEHWFYVVTRARLTQATAERILEKLAAWMKENRSNLPNTLTVIENKDFGFPN